MRSIGEKSSLIDSRLLYIRSNVDYSYTANLSSTSSASNDKVAFRNSLSSSETNNTTSTANPTNSFTSAGSNTYEILQTANASFPKMTDEEKNNIWNQTLNNFMIEHGTFGSADSSVAPDLSGMDNDQRMITLQQMRIEADQQRFAKYEQDLEEAKKRDAEKAAKENQTQQQQGGGNNTMGVILQAVQGIIGAFA